MNNGKILFILGMGRSGTSMLSAMLSKMGIEFGDMLHGPNEFNRTGYFEDPIIVDVNDRIIDTLNNHFNPGKPVPLWARPVGGPPKKWLHPMDWGDSWTKIINPETKKLLRDRISKSLDKHSFYAIKDPRVTILWPLYEELLNEINVNPYIITILRDLEAVQKSLFKFHGFKMPPEEVTKTYNRYYEDIRKYLPTMPKCSVKYEALLKLPEMHIEKIESFLAIDLTDEQKKEALSVVKKDLNHNSTLK